MKNIEIYSQIVDIEPRENLLDETLFKIRKIERRRTLVGAVASASLAFVSILSVFPIIFYISKSIYQSNVLSYMKLIFSDWQIVLSNWQEFVLSVSGSIPMTAITGVLLVLLVVVVSLNVSVVMFRDLKKINIIKIA